MADVALIVEAIKGLRRTIQESTNIIINLAGPQHRANARQSNPMNVETALSDRRWTHAARSFLTEEEDSEQYKIATFWSKPRAIHDLKNQL